MIDDGMLNLIVNSIIDFLTRFCKFFTQKFLNEAAA